MFTEFIWAGKRARMKLRLQATVRNGGLRLSNIQFYQEAFLVTQIGSLFHVSNKSPIWVEIEQELNSPFRAADYLSQSFQPDNPIMLHTKTMWHMIHKRELTLINSASLWNNPSLRIGGKLFHWRDWHNKGITNIGCLYQENTLHSFENLKGELKGSV